MEEKYSGLYEKYRDDRLLDKYKDYSRWTIATVFPKTTAISQLKGNDVTERDFQSLGAILVNSLASKLVSLLFPIGVSFFKISDNKDSVKLLNDLKQSDGARYKTTQMANIELKASERVLSNAGYHQLHQLAKLWIITGNALLVRKNNKLIVHSPRNYSVLRDSDGVCLDLILKEDIALASAPEEVRMNPVHANARLDDIVSIYTRVRRLPDGRHEVTQEADDKRLGEILVYARNLCPYIPTGVTLVNGDSYHHGIVEDYAGHFAKLSMLSEALAKYEIDAAKVINLVAPGAAADIDSLAEAECGEWVQADPNMVSKLETGNIAFIKALSEDISNVFNQLSIAFMYSANVRDAERVTAEEIKVKVAEVDKTLGGVYSQLSESCCKPLSYLLLAEQDPVIESAIKIGRLRLDILTGTAALGRSAGIDRLLQAMQVVSSIVPAMSGISKRFNTEKVIDKVLADFGIDQDEIMKSEEELQQEAQLEQQQMASLEQAQAGGQNIENIGGMLGGM